MTQSEEQDMSVFYDMTESQEAEDSLSLHTSEEQVRTDRSIKQQK